MDTKTKTIQTYNTSAQALADKFDALGARLSDINEAFALIKKGNPRVIEIGCGNGRDAATICALTNDYHGLDISTNLLQIARHKVPQGRFEEADVETYEFPSGVDIVFSFASLIHTPIDRLEKVFRSIYTTLNPGGVFRLSMKGADRYHEVTKSDEFGTRTYYHYSQGDIERLAQDFLFLKNEVDTLRGQQWLELLLQKPNN